LMLQSKFHPAASGAMATKVRSFDNSGRDLVI